MADNKGFRWGRLFVGVLMCGLIVVALVLQALFAVRVEPIVTSAPPEFLVQQREVIPDEPERQPLVEASTPESVESIDDAPEEIELDDTLELTKSEVSDLARSVFLDGESVVKLLALLKGDDRDARIAAALSLSDAFMEGVGENGYELRSRFWEQVGDDIEFVREALNEGLVDSVERDEYNSIPYVIAYMPGQNEETLELLAWASNNHQSAQMRTSAMFFVVKLDPKSQRTTQVLEQRRNDPSLRIRIDVLGHRLTRWVN